MLSLRGVSPVLLALAVSACSSSEAGGTPEKKLSTAELAGLLDAYFDTRFTGGAEVTDALVAELTAGGATVEQVEAAMRAPRGSYEDLDERDKEIEFDLPADHVEDFDFHTYAYVPGSYDPATPTALVFVGHGGNSDMSKSRANEVASQYLGEYRAFARTGGMIVVAPATTKGWIQVGNSILFSTVSWASRRWNIDPDRIYVTGQSMGGHLAYRTAMNWSDRFGAFAPQSGGYDFTTEERGKVACNLFDSAGYATYGTAAAGELYGIGDDNNKLAAWVNPRGYDWKFVEKDGGHEIFPDEHPKIIDFFDAHPRNLYKKRVFYKGGGKMRFEQEKLDTWSKAEVAKPGTVLRWNTRYWLEIIPRADAGALIVDGRVEADNRIVIEAMNAETLRVHVHPKMGLDLAKPIKIVVNGQEAHSAIIPTNLNQMLADARELDDRGRIFYGSVDVAVPGTHEVPDPSYP